MFSSKTASSIIRPFRQHHGFERLVSRTLQHPRTTAHCWRRQCAQRALLSTYHMPMIGSCSTNQHTSAPSSFGSMGVWSALLATFLFSSTSILEQDVVTACEEAAPSPNTDKSDKEEEEDPYDNLPEEDEPTNCSICMTYRKGPCRPYWRKVERCTKDNESKRETENDAEGDDHPKEAPADDDADRPDPVCFKYMMPWIDCATGFRNLYALIEMDTNYTDGIAELEDEATENLCWTERGGPTIDWSPWSTYVEEHPEWKLPKKRQPQTTPEKEALWKRLDQTTDPEVVQVEAMVPVTMGVGVLECAYAVDQDGTVLGFSYGTKPSQASSQSSAEKTDDNDEDNNTGTQTQGMTIRLMPKHTRRLFLAAAYTQPMTEENGPFESHVYRAKPYSLKKQGKQH